MMEEEVCREGRNGRNNCTETLVPVTIELLLTFSASTSLRKRKYCSVINKNKNDNDNMFFAVPLMRFIRK